MSRWLWWWLWLWRWHWLRLPGWPPVPRRLGLMLGGLALCLLNLALKKELWPHVPQADAVFAAGAGLLLLGILPQLLWLAWRWLRSWQGPALLRWLATAGFLAAAGLGVVFWLTLFCGGLYMALHSWER